MNTVETSKLLTIASLVDNRAVSPELVQVWQGLLDDIAFEDAVAALKAHYRTSAKWLMPATIRDLVLDAQVEARRAPSREKAAIRAWLLEHDIDWVRWEAGEVDAIDRARTIARDDTTAPAALTTVGGAARANCSPSLVSPSWHS